MVRASSPRTSPQLADPGDDSVHDKYDSYAITDEPSVFAGTAPEVSDCAACPGLTSSGLDSRPLLDRVTHPAEEYMSLKQYMAEKYEHFEEVEG